MANIITAGNSTNGGTAISTDTSGTLNIVTGSGSGATALTVDGSQNVAVNGNMSFNSGYGSAAVAYGCRAWVNFNGTGTVAIRASGNVTSITDNGTGDYTLNFTTAMVDANYCVSLGSVGYLSTNVVTKLTIKAGATTTVPALKTTTQLQIQYSDSTSPATNYDCNEVNVNIFR
jgi:hypothetical protein